MKKLFTTTGNVTIATNNWHYVGIHYEKGKILFQSVQNVSEEDLPVSISIALFDKKEKNIGTINYCSSTDILAPKEKQEYSISIEDSYLGPNKKIKDIYYMAVLSDNTNCFTDGSRDYIGQKVEAIGKEKTSIITEAVSFLGKGMLGLVGVLALAFLYKLLFTNAYDNMNGENIRKQYQESNSPKESPSQETTPISPPVAEELPKENTASETKENTDLQNLYK